MERAHVKAWPAFETADIEGWLWRYSGGGSQRANSVSTVQFHGTAPERAVEAAELRYRAKGVPARFHTFPGGAPVGLHRLLAARGYQHAEATVTMCRNVTADACPSDVTQSDVPDDAWRDVYLDAITPSRRAVNTRILENIPQPRRFFVCRRAGQVISTALSVVDGSCAVVECVATRPAARGQRGAEAVLRAIAGWAAGEGARVLALQVVATNEPALKLYRRLGYEPACVNEFWIQRMA